MLDIAKDASRGRMSDRELQASFGKLRSLSAGIDQLVDSTRYNGQELLNGQKIELRDGVSSTSKISIELDNLNTFGEDSLNLSTKEASAQATVFYKPATISFNSSEDLVGLDLSSATAVDVAVGQTELTTGDYQVEFIYEGPNSKVLLRDNNGIVRVRKENVDLSGSGQEIIDLGVGLQLSVQKEDLIAGDFDKYAYDLLGPVSLKADIEYRRNFRHVLTSGNENEITKTSVEFQNAFRTVDGDSILAFTDVNLVPVTPGYQELKTGVYDVRVKYNGANSTVELRDANRNLIGLQVVDLSEGGTQKLNLGVGVQVDLQNVDFTRNGAIANAQISYERSDNTPEDFDYRSYMKKIEDAISTIEIQNIIVENAIQQIQGKQQSLAQGSPQALANAQSSFLGGSSIVELLNSQLKGTAAKIFGVDQASQQLKTLTDGIFASANATISAQSDLRFANTVARVGSDVLA